MSKQITVDWEDIAEIFEEHYDIILSETTYKLILDNIWKDLRESLQTTLDHELRNQVRWWIKRGEKNEVL